MKLKFFTFTFKWAIRFFILFVLSIAGVLITSYLLGPPEISNDPITVFYDDEANSIGNKTEQEQTVVLEDIAPEAVDAIIVIEDRHFYDHHGFDIRGIIRAVWKNISSGNLSEGASTISQQYARNLYLSHEKTWLRKLKEAFYTIRLEMFYSKDTILTGYLNTIYYGHGAYGIEEASELFFDKKAKDLNLAEAAMIAGVPKGPTYYSPFNDKEKAKVRQELILKQMLTHNLIDQAEYYEAVSKELEFTDPDERKDIFANYFKDTALQEASTILKEDANEVLSSGYKIYTTLDTELQTDTEQSIHERIPDNSDIQSSIVTVNPKTGAIRSLIGGTDYEESTFNRAIHAKRLVGSAFKPILYYGALENGYTPSTMLLSKPTSFTMENGEVYEPKNFNGYYANKPISLSQAIAVSDNIYAVKTNLFLKPENVVDTAKKFGIQSDLPNMPSLALGSASISLMEMTDAYALIANEGKEVNSHTVTKIINQHGKTIYKREQPEPDQVLDEQKAFLLAHLMTGMFDRRLNGYMNVTGASIIDDLTNLYAGKSGTTNTDNWMIGFSPEAVTAVWTGYDDNQPIERGDEKPIAKNVWADTIEAAHKGKEDTEFKVPDGIVKKLIDPESGKLASDECPVARTTYFEAGTEPTEKCTIHSDEEKGNKEEKSESFWKKLLDLF